VNVILVDFRGIDTVVEITVLTIAAIGVYSLLKLKINSKGENQL
jgi:multicomponent Na+:H+ antiporter subunit A